MKVGFLCQITRLMSGQAVTTVTQDENDKTKRKEREHEENLIDDSKNNVQPGTGKKLKTKANGSDMDADQTENISDGWGDSDMDEFDDDRDTLMKGSTIPEEDK